ncbi:MAG: YIP1 family protein, partial [Thermoanaerobaculia bacterium]
AAWWAVLALILFGAFRLMGADVGYKQALSATLYAWVPLTLFSILSTIVIVMRGNVDPTHMATIVKSNPAFLVDMQAQPVLYSLLASFDVFTIWTIVLLVFGFAAASKFSRAKSAAIIVSLWIVMLVIKVGFAALGAARMNA